MKRIASIVIIFIIVIANSCIKNAANTNINNSIIGIWELRQVAGQLTINFDSGNGNLYRFAGTEYEEYQSNQLVKNGSYKIIADTTVEQNTCLIIPDNEYKNRIVFDNNFDTTSAFIQISQDSLFFISGCFANDAGLVSIYVKTNLLIQ